MQAKRKMISVRIPKDVHTRLRIRVFEDDITITEFIRAVIDDYLESDMEGTPGTNQNAPTTTPDTEMNASTHSDYRRYEDE